MTPNIEVSIPVVNRRIYGRAKYPLPVGKETFGDRVKRLRKVAKLSQEALAKSAGIKQSSLSVIETGATKLATIKAPTMKGLAAALKVTQHYLETGTEPPVKPGADPLLDQLTTLYAALNNQKKHELVRYANYLHSREHPETSTANPYGKAKAKTTA